MACQLLNSDSMRKCRQSRDNDAENGMLYVVALLNAILFLFLKPLQSYLFYYYYKNILCSYYLLPQ